MYYNAFLIFINFEQVAANSLVNILNGGGDNASVL